MNPTKTSPARQLPGVTPDQLGALCEVWGISRLDLFGSAARGEAGPDSDLDLLVSFRDGVHWDAFNILDLQSELERLTKRRVDLLLRRAVERSRNPVRRAAILDHALVIHGA